MREHYLDNREQVVISETVTCQVLVDLATEWMDGELESDQRMALEIHLATCAGCLAYVEQLRQTREVLGTGTEEPPPDDVRSRLVELFRSRGTGA
jgi:anti-sigma factor RsiW